MANRRVLGGRFVGIFARSLLLFGLVIVGASAGAMNSFAASGACDLWGYLRKAAVVKRPQVQGSVPKIKSIDLPPWLADDYQVLILKDKNFPEISEPVLVESVLINDSSGVIVKFASGEERYFPALSRDGIGDSATLPHLDMDQKELGHAPPYELIPVGEYVSRSSADPRMLHRIQKELDHFEKVDAPFKGEFEYRLQRGARRLASDPERAQLLVEEVSGDLRLQRTIDELNARLVDPSERAITEGPLSLIEIEEARRFLKKRAKLKDDLIDALLDSGVVGRPGSYETIDVAAARIYGSGEKIAKGRPVIVIPRKGKSYSSNLEVIESVTIATNPVSGKKVVKDIKKVRDTEVVRSRDLDEVVLVDAQEYFANPRLRLPKESKLRADYDGILARQAIEKVKAAAKIAERAGGKKPAKAVYSDTHQELVVVRLKNGEVFVARNGRRAIADQKWTFEVEGNLQQLDEATGYKKGYVIYDSAEVAEVIPVRKLRPIDAWTDPKNKDLVDAFEKFDALPNRIRRARLRRAQILEDKLDAAKEAAKKRGETFTIEEQAKIEMQIARDFEVIRKIEEEILKNPKSKRAKAIDAAHRAGEVSDPPKALTKKQLKEKDKILIEGGLTAAERRALMDLGITGDELQSAFAPYVYINGVQYAKRYKDVIVVRTDGTIQLVNELGYVQGDLFSLNLFEINPRPMDEVIVYGKGFTVKAGEFSIVGIDDPIVFTDPRFARVRTLLEERTSIFGWAKSLNQEIVPPKSLTSEPVAFFPNAQGLQWDSAFGYEIVNGELMAFTDVQRSPHLTRSLGPAENWSIVPYSQLKRKKELLAKNPRPYAGDIERWVEYLEPKSKELNQQIAGENEIKSRYYQRKDKIAREQKQADLEREVKIAEQKAKEYKAVYERVRRKFDADEVLRAAKKLGIKANKVKDTSDWVVVVDLNRGDVQVFNGLYHFKKSDFFTVRERVVNGVNAIVESNNLVVFSPEEYFSKSGMGFDFYKLGQYLSKGGIKTRDALALAGDELVRRSFGKSDMNLASVPESLYAQIEIDGKMTQVRFTQYNPASRAFIGEKLTLNPDGTVTQSAMRSFYIDNYAGEIAFLRPEEAIPYVQGLEKVEAPNVKPLEEATSIGPPPKIDEDHAQKVVRQNRGMAVREGVKESIGHEVAGEAQVQAVGKSAEVIRRSNIVNVELDPSNPSLKREVTIQNFGNGAIVSYDLPEGTRATVWIEDYKLNSTKNKIVDVAVRKWNSKLRQFDEPVWLGLTPKELALFKKTFDRATNQDNINLVKRQPFYTETPAAPRTQAIQIKPDM